MLYTHIISIDLLKLCTHYYQLVIVLYTHYYQLVIVLYTHNYQRVSVIYTLLSTC